MMVRMTSLHIRYGRISQKVPRRYKTAKKFSVLLLFFSVSSAVRNLLRNNLVSDEDILSCLFLLYLFFSFTNPTTDSSTAILSLTIQFSNKCSTCVTSVMSANSLTWDTQQRRDPNDFQSSGFTLRQPRYDCLRRTELFIVMTLYNEDEELFCRTMHGVIKNIAHLCKIEVRLGGRKGGRKSRCVLLTMGKGKSIGGL